MIPSLFHCYRKKQSIAIFLSILTFFDTILKDGRNPFKRKVSGVSKPLCQRRGKFAIESVCLGWVQAGLSNKKGVVRRMAMILDGSFGWGFSSGE